MSQARTIRDYPKVKADFLAVGLWLTIDGDRFRVYSFDPKTPGNEVPKGAWWDFFDSLEELCIFLWGFKRGVERDLDK